MFYCEDCKEIICTDETIARVSDIFAAEGSNAWYEKSATELLPEGFVCPKCGGVHFTVETDTLDGWFDSGSTHFAVLEENDEATWPECWPADLYLEGADQYRGWFQSSLLTAVGAKGEAQAPYKQVLTHGWVVDGEGKAMHKSLGNSIAPEEVITKYGADLVRMWVASSDYRVDVRVSDPIFKQLSETYRKIRNTSRIIMANLTGFDPNTDMVALDSLCDIDKWALARLNKLTKTVRDAYDSYDFHIVYHEVNNFCTIDMSKLYIDITKDRLYCEAPDGELRRSAQTAMYLILSALTRLLAPILAFTSDEIWKAMPHVAEDNVEHVLLNDMPAYDENLGFEAVEEHYDRLFDIRDDVMKALELARAEKLIGKSLEAQVEIFAPHNDVYELLSSFGDELSAIFITSDAKVTSGSAPEGVFCETVSGIGVKVSAAEGEMCDRCWMHRKNGKKTEDGFICDRCASVVGIG